MKNFLTITLCSDGDFRLEGLAYTPIFDDGEDYVFAFEVSSRETAIAILKGIMEAVRSSDSYVEHDVREKFLLAINDITYYNDDKYIYRSLSGNYSGTKIAYYEGCPELN